MPRWNECRVQWCVTVSEISNRNEVIFATGENGTLVLRPNIKDESDLGFMMGVIWWIWVFWGLGEELGFDKR